MKRKVRYENTNKNNISNNFKYFNFREVMSEQSKHPQSYIAEYDKFLYLIDGGAEREVQQYIKVEHMYRIRLRH